MGADDKFERVATGEPEAGLDEESFSDSDSCNGDFKGYPKYEVVTKRQAIARFVPTVIMFLMFVAFVVYTLAHRHIGPQQQQQQEEEAGSGQPGTKHPYPSGIKYPTHKGTKMLLEALVVSGAASAAVPGGAFPNPAPAPVARAAFGKVRLIPRFRG